MANKKLSDKIKKNLLDLKYGKYLSYYNTSIILLSTYFIGIIIAFITKQIDYRRINQLISVILISTILVGINVIFIIKAMLHLKNIPKEVAKLKL